MVLTPPCPFGDEENQFYVNTITPLWIHSFAAIDHCARKTFWKLSLERTSSETVRSERISSHLSTIWFYLDLMLDCPDFGTRIWRNRFQYHATHTMQNDYPICKLLTAWNPIHSRDHSSSKWPHSIESLKCDRISAWFTTDKLLKLGRVFTISQYCQLCFTVLFKSKKDQ